MKYFRIISIYLVFLIISTSNSVSELSKQDVYLKLLDIYGKVESVSLDFKLVGRDFSGNLIAKKGNKYKMKIDDRLIICNGKTIWNYSKKDNKVVIGDFQKDNENISLEDIFFSFIENFKPISLLSLDDSNSYSIKLKSKDSINYMSDISEVNLKITKKYIIKSIQIIENNETLTWQINKLKCTNHIDDNEFEFTLPKKCTVIDLR